MQRQMQISPASPFGQKVVFGVVPVEFFVLVRKDDAGVACAGFAVEARACGHADGIMIFYFRFLPSWLVTLLSGWLMP